MSKKSNSSNNNKDRASNLSPDSVDAQIHGNRAGSSADKARGKVTTTGSERVQGSSQSAPPTSSKTHTTETRGLGRSTDVATGGIANKNESVGIKAEELVDADSDELYLDSDVSADDESWRQIARNFAIKPYHSQLPKLGLDELRDQVDFRGGYHMVKPKEMQSWEQLQSMFAIPNDLKPTVAQRKAELYRMFPDLNCDFDQSDFGHRSMWDCFHEQRRVEMNPEEDEDEKDDEEPEPKKGKSSPIKGAKGRSVDSDEDSPTPPPSPPAKLQTWRWDLYYRRRTPCQSHHKPIRSDMMWRCGDPPSMWQMCDSPNEDSTVVGLTTVELGNLLAGLHPRDVKRHGYTITRVISTLRYLEAKAERMYAAGQQLSTRLQSAQLSNVMANNRRTLEAARRHTTEEVQGLRASLEKAQKELEEQRLAHVGQQRTSIQVEEEQQEQLTALERARDDAIDSLNDLREDLDRSSSRIQIQSETIEGLRRQLDDARNTIRATERFRHHAQDMSEEIFSLREQLNLVTAAAEAADRELAERELTRNNDEQVIAERDRACADRDAARLASETANREASITKRQRDEYMSLLAAESARLVQVQQELQQAKESEARGARAAASSITAMPSRIEVSTSIGGTPMLCPVLQHPPEIHPKMCLRNWFMVTVVQRLTSIPILLPTSIIYLRCMTRILPSPR